MPDRFSPTVRLTDISSNWREALFPDTNRAVLAVGQRIILIILPLCAA
jgi:hypothetical protein